MEIQKIKELQNRNYKLEGGPLTAGASEESIIATESFLGELPDEYKLLLKNSNGGSPSGNSSYDFFDNMSGHDNTSDVFLFYGVSEDIEKNELIEMNSGDFSARYPNGFIAIGEDSGGNKILLNLKSSEVYYWDFDFQSEEGEEATLANCSLISASFSDFIGGIYAPEPISDEELNKYLP